MSNNGERRTRIYPQSGFSVTELLIVVAIILVITGIAIPIYKSAMDSIRVQEAARNYAGILQRARLTAVTGNTYNAVGVQFLSGSNDLIAYVDTADTNVSPPSAYTAPEPMTMLGYGVISNQPGAPATNDLKTKVFSNGTLGYPPVFGSRGLPCAPISVTGGTVCNTQGGNVAYATYFQSPLGQWRAVTVNPVGRIQIWAYDPGTSVWNQV